MSAPALVWFRQDLRLADNPALVDALAATDSIVPVYILDNTGGSRAPGGAAQWWLHHALAALADAIAARGGRLILRRGDPADVLDALIAETGADRVYWNRCYEPQTIARDTAIKSALEARGIVAESRNASLLFEPWTIATKQGAPYQVYTPFWRACRAAPAPPVPAPAPPRLNTPPAASETLTDWDLLPTTPDWAGGLREAWTPGAAGAAARLDTFLSEAVAAYKSDRNRPDLPKTSRLSPYLRWGEIGPRQVWHAAEHAMAQAVGGAADSIEHFLKELVWREFAYHLLYHFPQMPTENLRAKFDGFPWVEDPDGLAAWQRGRTGYPIVDAGMRELWHTGWMHNRVRMIVASFLIKDLRLHWREGEAWFWDTLVDADPANNTASWQWVAGSGADAAPYFRIFNPVSQAQKFDPQGAYVRRWVPELARLSDANVHQPWEAGALELDAAGVRLGRTYPHRIVDHGVARKAALDAFQSISDGATAAPPPDFRRSA